MTSRRVKELVILADERTHTFNFWDDVLAVTSARDNPNELEIWVEVRDDEDPNQQDMPNPVRHLRVFGAGQAIPLDAKHQGTTGRAADGTVWHLYEVVA
jgi:hypothetical protein